MSFHSRSLAIRTIFASTICAVFTACDQSPTAPAPEPPFSALIAVADTFELLGTTAALSFLNPNTLLRIDHASGSHSLAGPIGRVAHTNALAWNPRTMTLFASDQFGPNPGVVQEIDLATGIAVPVATILQAGIPAIIGSLAVAPTGTLWATVGPILGVIDLNTQSFLPRLPLPIGFFPNAIDITSSGLLYAVLQALVGSRRVLLTIDISVVPVIVGFRDLVTNFSVDDIAAAPDGLIYHTNFSGALVRIDPASAAATLVGFGTLGALGGIASVPIDIDRDGVPNRDDECPRTPPGSTVDASGCTSQQRIERLNAQVDALLASGALTPDQATALAVKLAAALAAINGGRMTAACGQLAGFNNHLGALLLSGALSSAIASQLQDAASAIQVQIGC